MDFINNVVIILLTLVGYSSGKVLAGRSLKILPALWDVVAVLLLWVSAVSTRAALGKWSAVLVWLVLGGVVGAVGTFIFKKFYVPLDIKEQIEETGLRRIWQGWKAFAMEMGDFQGRMLLIWFYFIIVTPFGFLVRVFSDPLKIKKVSQTSYWIARTPDQSTLEDMKRQF